MIDWHWISRQVQAVTSALAAKDVRGPGGIVRKAEARASRYKLDRPHPRQGLDYPIVSHVRPALCVTYRVPPPREEGSSAYTAPPSGVWLTGALYALFALPAKAYLLDTVLR